MTPLFLLQDLCFAFDPKRPLLQNLNLALYPQQRIAVTGATGCGKTSLLHLLVGLLKPQSGILTAFGLNPHSEADFRSIRVRAGLLFQDPDDQLFCPTVAEDIAFGPLNLGKTYREAEQLVDKTLNLLGLDGYQQRITYQLSGGEKRLVSLATLLAMEPEVLLLDEPTNGLDEQAAQRIKTILANLPQAMIIVSHDRWLLEGLVDQQFILRDGQLL